MYCKYCGQPIDDRAVICPHCGVATGNDSPAADDAPSPGFAVLCFFFPLLGLILYLLWHDNYPKKARSCGKGALIGVIVETVFGTLISVLFFIIFIGAAAVDASVAAACCALLV